MEDLVYRPEYEEFKKRMQEENHRQNRRIELLEKTSQQINALAASVERLATNMENMLKNLEAQGERLEVLEGRDGEMWRKVAGYLVTAVSGILVGYIFNQMNIK